MKKKYDSAIPTIIMLKPYGEVWIELNEEHRRLIFIDLARQDREPTEEEYWTVALYLWEEGFIEAVERGEM